MVLNRIDINDWYTADEAARRLSANSGRKINASYPRTLARAGKITSLDIGSSGRPVKLYLKKDIDAYIVSTKRGPKARKEAEEAIA